MMSDEQTAGPTDPKPQGANNIEYVLATRANDAMSKGADPHAVTTMLGQMITHLRANPNHAASASNALAQGADPAAVASTVYELSNSATGHESETPQAPAAAPRSNFSNALSTANNAMTFGLGQKFNAAFNAVGDKIRGKDTFGHSYTTNLAAEHQGIDDFRNAHPIASGVAAGVGAVVPSLLAGPEAEAGVLAKALPMGKRIAEGTKVGAGLGAVNALGNSQNTSSVGDQFKTAAKGGIEGGIIGGGMTAGAEVGGLGARIKGAKPLDEHAVAVDDANTAANIKNYGKAIAEGKQTPTTPSVRSAIEHPDIGPYVDMYRNSTKGKGSTDADALRNAFKGISREQMRLEEAQKAKQGGYDYAAELKVSDLKAAKKIIKNALGEGTEAPARFLNVPGTPERPEIQGPEVTKSAFTIPSRETTGFVHDGSRFAPETEHPSGPTYERKTPTDAPPGTAKQSYGLHVSFQNPELKGPETTRPGFTMPAVPKILAQPDVKVPYEGPRPMQPAAMPSFPDAVAAKARMERSAEMLRNGADAGLRIIRGNPVSGKNLTKTSTAAYLRDIGKMSEGDAEDALPGVLGRAKEFVGPNSDIKSGFGLGPSMRALRVSPFVKALDQQAGKPRNTAPLLTGSIVGGTQSLEELLKNVLGTP